MRAADVERDAGGAQVRPREAHPQRRRRVDRPEAAHPPDEDLVLVEQALAGLDLLGRAAHPVAEPAHEVVVEVAVDAADAEVVEEHPLAGQRGEHLDDLVPLDERPQDRRQAAEIERHPAQEQGVAGDPVELRGEHPDVLGAARDLDVEQLLEAQDRAPLVEQRADVFERVDLADDLVVVGVLGELLDAAVEVAEDRVEVDDVLALDLEHHPEHAVRRRMLGPHVEEHLAVAERVELGLALGSRRVGRDGLEDAGLLVEQDARIVGRRPLGRRHGFAGSWREPGRRRTAALGLLVGRCACSMWREPAPGERAASSGRWKSLRSGKLVYSGGM